MNLLRQKEIMPLNQEMKRHLTTVDLVFLGLGSIVGTGIFTITGIGAAMYAGPALTVSIIIAALTVTMSALFYAEFASRMSNSGGAYGYLYVVFGEFPAWIVGWLMMLQFLAAISGVASGWSSYFKSILAQIGMTLPTAINGTFDMSKGQFIDILPIFVMGLVIIVVLLNSKAALRLNSLLVMVKFSALLLFIIVGIFHINSANYIDFAPFGWGELYGGETGIIAGASLMFFAFAGFESVSMASDEVKNPQKTVPKGILICMCLVTLLYVIVTLVLTGMVHYTQLNVPDAVAYALRVVGMDFASQYVSGVAVLTLITVCIAITYALSRMVYSISRDGLLPKAFSRLSPKHKVPKNATIVIGVCAAIMASVVPLASIASFLNLCTYTYLLCVALGILQLRRTHGLPDESQFKTPFVPLLPLLSIVLILFLMTQYSLETWKMYLVAVGIGVTIYIVYGYKHSTMNSQKN